MKIVTVIGARPQFIKSATVTRAIKKHNDKNPKTFITEVIIHTGQHFDSRMSQIFFEEMQIPEPNYNLGIHSLNHGAMTGRMLEGIEALLLKEQPDWVLVYGDTNSTMAAALAASKLHIKIAHVEAGLRSFNIQMPEEINRVITDRISSVLFCPTVASINNLRSEGFPNKLTNGDMQQIIKVGDVMYDSALFYSGSYKPPELFNSFFINNFCLATVHRQENTNDTDKLKSILTAFEMISKEIAVILPLHPRTRERIKELKFEIKNLHIIEPVSYLEMIWLLRNCSLVMTDSGGVQKEAFFFKKPCITLREQTEWTELVEQRVNYVAGTDVEKILVAYRKALNINRNFSAKPYGDGFASEKIIKKLLEHI